MLLLYTLSLFLLGAHSSPVEWELVDMTRPFDETTQNWPTLKSFKFNVILNETTPDGYWLQVDEIESAIHVGTHMDAPCHFVMGKWCVDEIPFERFSAPAAVVDITEKAEADPDAMVDISDLEKWEQTSGKNLDGTIVIIKSGWGKKYHDKSAFFGTPDCDDTTSFHFPGMNPEAAQWLVDKRDIYGVLTESISLDQGPSRDFMSHRILLGGNIYGCPNVANVDKIPAVGAIVTVMPMKITNGSGGPARIFAKYPKE